MPKIIRTVAGDLITPADFGRFNNGQIRMLYRVPKVMYVADIQSISLDAQGLAMQFFWLFCADRLCGNWQPITDLSFRSSSIAECFLYHYMDGSALLFYEKYGFEAQFYPPGHPLCHPMSRYRNIYDDAEELSGEF
jgi:hypothetical protein